jgi:sterol desaturase/sphingolipid hydroxylase (fatty acid hydroxylase superfamily)
LTNHSFGFYGFVLFGIILSRYFLIAGGTYFCFYSFLGESFVMRGRRKPPEWALIRKDIQLAVLSAAVFALCAAFVVTAYDLGETRLYADLDQYGLWYLGVSYGAFLLLQDTYFYFIHRLLHHPRLYRWMHHGHHRSGEPTPWASFAFDLPEALIQAIFFAGIVFVMPLHFITLIAALLTMSLWSVLNHLGFRLFPAAFPGHWLGEWLIGPMHHSLHHRKYTLHYGLYFTLWDKLLGTHEPNYAQALSDRPEPGSTP